MHRFILIITGNRYIFYVNLMLSFFMLYFEVAENHRFSEMPYYKLVNWATKHRHYKLKTKIALQWAYRSTAILSTLFFLLKFYIPYNRFYCISYTFQGYSYIYITVQRMLMNPASIKVTENK